MRRVKNLRSQKVIHSPVQHPSRVASPFQRILKILLPWSSLRKPWEARSVLTRKISPWLLIRSINPLRVRLSRRGPLKNQSWTALQCFLVKILLPEMSSSWTVQEKKLRDMPKGCKRMWIPLKTANIRMLTHQSWSTPSLMGRKRRRKRKRRRRWVSAALPPVTQKMGRAKLPRKGCSQLLKKKKMKRTRAQGFNQKLGSLCIRPGLAPLLAVD